MFKASGSEAHETALSSLNDDLGHCNKHPPYELDEEIRDTLIAHGRQDAAHALINSHNALVELAELKKMLRRIEGICIASLVALMLMEARRQGWF